MNKIIDVANSKLEQDIRPHNQEKKNKNKKLKNLFVLSPITIILTIFVIIIYLNSFIIPHITGQPVYIPTREFVLV